MPSPLEDSEVEQRRRTPGRRVTRYLPRHGRLPYPSEGEGERANADELCEPLFAALCAASVQGRTAVQPRGANAVR